MHMADALLSPAVGGGMWAASAGLIVYSSRKLHREFDDRRVPLMGVMGAFLFAAQMINFTIPGTGSSGHLGGGLLLAILLGPHAAFLTVASVLVVQALFFADGGLLALGCNIFNLGFFPAFVVYPLVFSNMIGRNPSRARLTAVTVLCAMLGLQLGPLGVVLETALSGISAIPLNTFLLLMLPIHLAIGAVEGVVTATVVGFIHQARPEILRESLEAAPAGASAPRRLTIAFLCASVLIGGALSGYASRNPDGLEWAVSRATAGKDLKAPDRGIHAALAGLQGGLAFMPGYGFKKSGQRPDKPIAAKAAPAAAGGGSRGTGAAGIIGTLITLALTVLSGVLLKRRARPA